MAELADLLLAIAALLAVLLLISLFAVGVWWPKRLQFFKWKFKDVEAEFRGAIATVDEVRVAIPPSAPATGGSATAEAISPEPGPAEDKKEQLGGPTKKEDPPTVFSLLKDRKYTEALSQLRQENVDRADADRIEFESFFYWMAFVDGFQEAFSDLEKHMVANPDNWGPHYWFGRVLESAGRPVEALASTRKAYSLAETTADRIQIAEQEADLLFATGSSRLQAARVIGKELRAAREPSARGRIFAAVADLFKADNKIDTATRLLMLEAAVHNNPSDPDLLFKTAFAYGESGAEDFALAHYRQLIAVRADHPHALNNAGVAAERLEMPITGVNYYKRAEKNGESLATANLAATLLKAGFLDEAKERLFQARATFGDQAHRNVSHGIGNAARLETNEEDKAREFRIRVSRASKWRVRLGEAILQDDTVVRGVFAQDQNSLEILDDGSVRGMLKIDSKDAPITGVIIGSAVEFTWKTVKPTATPGSLESLLGTYYQERSGFGRAVISGATIEGYYGDGEHPVDSTGAEKWVEFSLSPRGA